jgi:branched-chain amino acid transport system ATP-binding protein
MRAMPMPDHEAFLSVRDLRVEYRGGVPGVAGVSLDLQAGGMTAVVGPNGAGKTSLLRAISGRLPGADWKVASGQITLGGDRIDRMPTYRLVRKGVVMVPERDKVFPDLTVKEHLNMGRDSSSRGSRTTRIDRAIELFPVLERLLRQRAGHLSGGERQMVAIAVAMCSQPRLLLIDEMSQGLSAAVLPPLVDAVRRVHDEGMTVLAVEQNARLALELTSNVYVMGLGSFVTSGAVYDAVQELRNGMRMR